MGEGLPFITNFSPSTYQQGPQNFAVIQDKKGFLYFGNNNGVVRYDGHRWELYPVTNRSEVHSVAEDKNGRVYVGAQGEFGYLQHDLATGKLQYNSLLHLVPDSATNFNDVWNIYVRENDVVFRSTAALYFYRDNQIKVLPLHSSTHRSFRVYNDIFVREQGMGLRKLEGDSLVSIPDGDKFLQEPIHSMFPYEGGRYLAVSQNQGIFIYDGKSFEPMQTEVNKLIQGQSAYGEFLSDGSYAFGTRRSGLIIMDKDGRLRYHLKTSEGLINESVWAICNDRFSGNIWVATNNGISFVELGSPFTIFRKQSNLPGQIYHIVESDEVLYAATSLGVYTKTLNDTSHHFRVMEDIQASAWHFYKDGNTILVASNRGIDEIVGGKKVRTIIPDRSWFFLPLKHRPGYVLVNTIDAFVVLQKKNGIYQVHSRLPRFYESLYFFCEDSEGNIWADSPIKGIYKITLNADASDLTYTLYNSAKGFPTDFKNIVFQFGGDVRFGTANGIYAYNPALDSITFDHDLTGKIFGNERPAIEIMEQDYQGNLWFVAGRKEGVEYYSCGGFARREERGTYTTHSNVFMRVRDFRLRSFLNLDGKHTYISTSDGVLNFDATKIRQMRYPVVITKMQFLKNDSTVNLLKSPNLTIPYHLNNIRFEFASMQFGANTIEYQTYLEGFDSQWQAYSDLALKEYTQLPPGDYVFRLRAKNWFNQVSDELAFPFRVVAPWYSTSFAYGTYVLIVLLLIYYFTQWRARQLVLKNMRLEALVQDRTTELQRQNDHIKEKNLQLGNQKQEIEAQKEDIERTNAELVAAKNIIAEQNEELRHVNYNLEKIVSERTSELQNAYQNLLETKNELNTFIYRSSHDIKGPLLRLLGLCNVALMDVRDEKAYGYFKKLENEIKNTNRILQKLIVFHYVKNAEVKITTINLKEIIGKALVSLRSLQGFDEVMFEIEDTLECDVQSDSYLLEAALCNVLENAIVYRKEEGTLVRVRLESIDDQYQITITDNGRGISREAADKIFSMFFRGSEASSGAGLGLYIANEALKKVKGTIRYTNQEPTTFTLSLPAMVMQDFVCQY